MSLEKLSPFRLPPIMCYHGTSKLLGQGFHYARVELRGMRSWEGDLLDEIVGEHVDKRAVSVGVELRHVEKLGIVKVL